MTGPLRVLLVGRRFWPHCTIDAGYRLFQLACGIRRQGLHVEVVTPRYESSSPDRFSIRDVVVHRPIAAPRSDWSMSRYVRQLTQWLRAKGSDFDVILVDAMREESTAVINAAQWLSCPAVLHAAGSGQTSDLAWWGTNRAARRCGAIAKLADAVIAADATTHRGLVADGFEASRLHRIERGFAPIARRSHDERVAARRVLGAANRDLHAGPDDPVILSVSRMTADSGVGLLVHSTRQLVTRFPGLRVWFVGDGPERDSLYERLRGDGVRASIAMPGSFAEVEDLFAAADMYVQPDEHGLASLCPAAISAELPTVAIDTPATREMIEARDTDSQPPLELIELVSGATSRNVRQAITNLLDDPEQAQQRASELKKRLVRSRPEGESFAAYASLLRRVASQGSRGNQGTSVEVVR